MTHSLTCQRKSSWKGNHFLPFRKLNRIFCTSIWISSDWIWERIFFLLRNPFLTEEWEREKTKIRLFYLRNLLLFWALFFSILSPNPGANKSWLFFVCFSPSLLHKVFVFLLSFFSPPETNSCMFFLILLLYKGRAQVCHTPQRKVSLVAKIMKDKIKAVVAATYLRMNSPLTVGFCPPPQRPSYFFDWSWLFMESTFGYWFPCQIKRSKSISDLFSFLRRAIFFFHFLHRILVASSSTHL